MPLTRYKPLSVADEEDRDSPPSNALTRISDTDDGGGHEETRALDGTAASTSIETLEIEQQDASDEEDLVSTVDCTRILSACLSLCLTTPVVVLTATTLYQLMGRAWIMTPFISHWIVTLLACHWELRGFWKVSLASGLLDTLLFLVMYRALFNTLIGLLFTDIDETPVVEWLHERQALQTYCRLGIIVGFCRAWLVLVTAIALARNYVGLHNVRFVPMTSTRLHFISKATRNAAVVQTLEQATKLLLFIALWLFVWSLVSVLVHFVHWPPPHSHSPGCDPLDLTECWLPFPSFHHMQWDPSTETGWRVNLNADALPHLKGGVKMDVHWLNELDGFSTMGPILFYLNGLKEAYEAGMEGLQGHSNIAKSVTPQSITLLLDVEASRLVPHSAEIDYLDIRRPQVMMFPAYPLRHATHYAVVMTNATGVDGQLLDTAAGMVNLFSTTAGADTDRLRHLVLPSLKTAAPWLSLDRSTGGLQLLFDFVTASERSQLGHVRGVRDAVLAHIESPEWDWSEHYREVRRVDYDCQQPGVLLARTVHSELDVPWFLDCYGPGCRSSFLDEPAVEAGTPTTIGSAKFVLHIPCSLQAGALRQPRGKPLRAVMEFGHGLFANRAESFDYFLQHIAHEEGYAVIAMDWRGMSVYDLMIIGRMLLSRPRLFRAVRDNLIQGYANKYALQHFSRHGEIWNTAAFSFEDERGAEKLVPLFGGKSRPSFVFYGISQGGILGAGYSAMSKGLIDRAVLGVPGTPFALIMSRSSEFVGYDLLMLLDFYDNRQVRMLLALCQMGWDSVEGSGVLAAPISESVPMVLLQAGLGDSIVPSIAAEALARGFGAAILPHNPRKNIFGIQVANITNGTLVSGSKAILTELLYEREYKNLPIDDLIGSSNLVHICVRLDQAMIRQVAEFISKGVVVDPCTSDGCLRAKANC